MNKYGKEILENMLERILTRIQKETWKPFSFVNHRMYYSDYDKEITLYFGKEDWGFRFAIFTDVSKENWIENMRMEVDEYTKEKGEKVSYTGHGKILTEPNILEKIYNLVKKEVERTFLEDEELRMKYIFNKEEMLKEAVWLRIVLERIREDEKDEIKNI